MNSGVPLPPNFIVYRDQQSGRDYFVDRNTGRSQWEDPRNSTYGSQQSMQGYGTQRGPGDGSPQYGMSSSYTGQYQQGASYGGYQGSPQQQQGGYYQQGPPRGGHNQQGPPPHYGGQYQSPPPGYHQGYQYQQPPPQQVIQQAPKKESFFKKHSMLTGLAAGGLAAFGVSEFMEHEQEERQEAYDAGVQSGYDDGYDAGFDDGGF
ncbi:hypothetical protein COEREDRAFT_81873 [Coemansia reversa NRRL 1564]|uniref:WW domain-containing protein n=1 Tax=Coemansia reversa (strain ATCC 12441 / NRRL 1564) TaxID=763665 RepID=A0A2G5B950_COERN|nr:hypothetical protein COEREDRAFT_81873 [Coemansia reversa NRRL 1564]|eukprot:PIA15538.1 hypothetical protein COEREDRAFT_81873 [Coemansia reversa NRRL 1564]